MARTKVAISLAEGHQARACHVSANVLAEHEQREPIRTLLEDLIAQHGEPAPKDIKWAERALGPRRRRP